jgi:hypothetical protein
LKWKTSQIVSYKNLLSLEHGTGGAGAMDPVDPVDHLVDPVTKEVLVHPYLASDGETYSKDTLVQAMAADPWHRSPVTYEVLRPVAYPNLFARALLGGDDGAGDAGDAGDRAILFLYDPKMDVARARGDQPHARTVTWTMPRLLPAEDTLIRRRFHLPDAGFQLQAVITRDAAGLDWLMYPPCALDMRDDVLALAKSVGAAKSVQNPWCLSGALVVVVGAEDDVPTQTRTVEDWWVSSQKR